MIYRLLIVVSYFWKYALNSVYILWRMSTFNQISMALSNWVILDIFTSIVKQTHLTSVSGN